MAWSGFGQTYLVWKQAEAEESSGPVSGRTQPACCQFPTFRLSSVLPQMSQIILCKTRPGSDLVLADCVRIWPNGSGPEVMRKNASQLTQTGCELDPARSLGFFKRPIHELTWVRCRAGTITKGNSIHSNVSLPATNRAPHDDLNKARQSVILYFKRHWTVSYHWATPPPNPYPFFLKPVYVSFF